MALDYRGPRGTVNKNRPKKQAGGMFTFVMLGALATAFSAGAATGWFASKHFARKAAKAAATESGGAAQNAVAPVPGAPVPAGSPEGKGSAPPLTFYETLPKGGRSVVIGTGINPVKPDQPAPAQAPTVQPATPAKPPVPPPAQAKPQTPPVEPARPAARGADGKEAPGKPVEPAKQPVVKAPDKDKPAAGKGRLSVQVASFPARKEADEMRARLAAKGFDAYVLESNVPDKGIRYRVRVGRHLEQGEAEETLQKLGKGAIILPE